MGLTGDEKALACRIIRGRAVVVGVTKNVKKCILNAKAYILIPAWNIAFTVLKICIYGYIWIHSTYINLQIRIRRYTNNQNLK